MSGVSPPGCYESRSLTKIRVVRLSEAPTAAPAVDPGLSFRAALRARRDAVAARGLVEAFSQARAIPCTFPRCGRTFRTVRGLRIHRTLAGHQRVVDAAARGDGDAARSAPAHPALRKALVAAGMMDGPAVLEHPMPCSACGEQMDAGATAYPSTSGPVCADCRAKMPQG